MPMSKRDADLLAGLDFSGTGPIDPRCLPPPPPPNDDGLVGGIAAAAEEGDLVAVGSLVEQLRRHLSGTFWLADTHGLLAGWGDNVRPRGLGNALLLAARRRHADVVEYLLEQGIRPTNIHARLALHRRDTDTLELFLRHQWDINETENWYRPPLMAEVVRDSGMVSFFLRHSADPNARSTIDQTPLSEAVRFAPFSTIKLMFDHGGSVHRGQLLHWSLYRDFPDALDVTAFLLSRHAAIDKVMYEDCGPSYAWAVVPGVGTPLHIAAQTGNLTAARFLVENGAHPLIEDSWGGTPLQCAEKTGHLHVVDYLRPITAASTPPAYQFTRGRGVHGWETFYAKQKQRL